jgi:hypothetical protein
MEAHVLNITMFIVAVLLAFGLNVPLGMWRVTTVKFSIRWFVAIHLAVPLIYFIRISTDLPSWVAPILIAAAVLGQLVGGFLRNGRPQANDKTM